MTTNEKRRQVLEGAEKLADSLLEQNPDITGMVRATHLTIGEIALVFEERLRKMIPVPLEVGSYHAGQAAHRVRSDRIHAQVAEIQAAGV
jgi:hypothetical protein